MRYVKLKGMEPGMRFDLVTMQPVYSSRFLNAEEHLNTPWWQEVWATLFCSIISLPLFVRRHLVIRWMELTALEFFLCLCGIFLCLLVIFVEVTA
jgi:hypothetical protein